MVSTVWRLAAGTALAVLLAGCSMGSMFGGNGDSSYANIDANPAQIAQAASGAMPAIATECPPIRIRDGAEFYRSYVGNRTSDPSALRFQTVIDRVSRNCVASNGLITVDMGAVGRVIVGPAGTDGNVTAPLRFAVERDGLAVFSQRYDIPVTTSASNANEFSHTVENVAIPYVGGETITIWVGFDN